MRALPEFALMLAVLLPACAPVTPPVNAPDAEALIAGERVGPAQPDGELSEYLELASVVADAPPDRTEPIRRHFESALVSDERSIAARMQLAMVLVNDPDSSVAGLERARELLNGLSSESSVSIEIKRFAELLIRMLDQRLTLSRLLVERAAELDRAATTLVEVELSRDETRLEIMELREELAATRTKLREIVRIEQAVETSGSAEARP